MKRFALKLGLFLLLGAIINIAVAWGIAFMVDPHSGSVNVAIRVADDVQWQLVRHSRAGATWIHSRRIRGSFASPAGIGLEDLDDLLPRWSDLGEPRQQFRSWQGPIVESRALRAEGFPMLALWSERGGLFTSRQSYEVELEAFPLEGALEISPDGWPLGLLPPVLRNELCWRPIWTGFFINSALYGAILYAPLILAPATLRATRSRRGLCGNCGYDLRSGGLSACPECGEGAALATDISRVNSRPWIRIAGTLMLAVALVWGAVRICGGTFEQRGRARPMAPVSGFRSQTIVVVPPTTGHALSTAPAQRISFTDDQIKQMTLEQAQAVLRQLGQAMMQVNDTPDGSHQQLQKQIMQTVERLRDLQKQSGASTPKGEP